MIKIIKFCITILITIIVIINLLYVGYMVLNEVSDEVLIVKGFCIDKEGMYNLNDYDYELKIFEGGDVNCSNKDNPLQFNTLI